MAKEKVFLIPPPRMTSLSSSVHNVYFYNMHIFSFEQLVLTLTHLRWY